MRNSLRYPRLRSKSLANGDARFWCTQLFSGRPKITSCLRRCNGVVRLSLPISGARTCQPEFTINQERQGVPARWGDPARGIPTAKPPTVRESHEPGRPLEPGPLAPCPSQRGAEGGEGSRPEGGVPARGGGLGVPALDGRKHAF